MFWQPRGCNRRRHRLRLYGVGSVAEVRWRAMLRRCAALIAPTATTFLTPAGNTSLRVVVFSELCLPSLNRTGCRIRTARLGYRSIGGASIRVLGREQRTPRLDCLRCPPCRASCPAGSLNSLLLRGQKRALGSRLRPKEFRPTREAAGETDGEDPPRFVEAALTPPPGRFTAVDERLVVLC